MFDALIELNSIIRNGFLMNKVISLFNDEEILELNDDISEEGLIIMKNALKYIDLIINGREFVVEKKVVKDLDKSLSAFNISLNALDQSEKDLTFEKFNEIISKSNEQIKKSLENRKMIRENIDISLILFESIRIHLMKKAEKINIDEISIF